MALAPPKRAEVHRLELQDLLENVDESPAYFQPPGTLTLVYPCKVYQRDKSKVSFADNQKFLLKKRWTVTVIDRNPDSDIPDLIENLRWSEFDRFFVVDGLNHWVFTLYY